MNYNGNYGSSRGNFWKMSNKKGVVFNFGGKALKLFRSIGWAITFKVSMIILFFLIQVEGIYLRVEIYLYIREYEIFTSGR